jgi:hypothetical protein
MTRLTLVGAAIAIAVGCTTVTPTPSPVTPLELWGEAESELVPPGSEVLDRREGEAGQTGEGTDTASVGLLIASRDSPAEVDAFYERELVARGWQPATDLEAIGLRIRTTTELSARSWRKGDLVFRLGILDMTDPFAEGPSEGYATVYRISLVDRPPKPDGS